MANGKELSVEEQVAQQIALINKELELKQEQREANKVELGAKVVDTRVNQGAPVIDKTSAQQKVVNGVPQCYPDKYFVTLSYDGGSLETEIKSKDIFDTFETNKRYFCEGYLGFQKIFGVDTLMPIFTKFTKI